MSVRRERNGPIILDGTCTVEDAEPLLQMLQQRPAAEIDWTRCKHLHTAVLQVIIAARPALVGPCADPWVQQWVAAKPS